MTAPQWTADIAVDAALAARLIAGQFPALAHRAVVPFGNGWDNAAFLAGGDVVFRFPRRRIVANLIEREVAVLPRIAPHVPLAISAPAFVGTATSEYPWPFAGYPLIRGTTACSVELTESERTALAEPLGAFLRALHALDPQPFIAAGLPSDELGRLEHARRTAVTRERVAALAATGFEPDLTPFAEWLETHPPRRIAHGDRRVVHGDLYARHVVLDDEHRAAGIIDWGDLHFGDPALDLAIAHSMLPPSAHAAFRAAYGPIDAATWETARYRAIYHAVLELDYGLRENDVGMRASAVCAFALLRR